MTKIVKLSSKHQGVIPREARKKLSLRAGDQLAVEVEREKVVLRLRPKNYTNYMLGLGKEIWEGIDASEYVRKERESWKK
ncbi:MAG: AbrB/MazE/SpoVT family DNA-binding domain-containing protein [Candidatus Aerophobetes bacterium]|nr:AbrB/MazE/SpoVT family DNA-binding domain-containing protein [Candidatus Aerophobetes bacterium]